MQIKLDKIEILKEELASLSFALNDQRRLDEKFRLEFNYNTNHMEGNTITIQDAKALLLKDIVDNRYTFKELREMKEHDIAFSKVKEWATDQEREITLTDIKNLNEMILIRNYLKDAQTPDGHPSRKEIKVGDYKDTPNSVMLPNGEMHYYADPTEVPSLMQDLMDWYHREKSSLHPIALAAVFHHKFVTIHPFDDGNGRIARLLVNYILIRFGYPPIVIKSIEKQKYLTALHLADAGKIEVFIDFILDQVIWSLEIATKAAKGESIDEIGDLNKKLEFLLNNNNLKSDISGKYSIANLDNIINNSLSNFFDALEEMLLKFDMLFNERRIRVSFDFDFFKVIQESKDIRDLYYEYSTIDEPFSGTSRREVNSIHLIIELRMPTNLNQLIKDVDSDGIQFNFFTNRIEVKTYSGQVLSNFTYYGGIEKDEIDKIIEFIGNDILNKMKTIES